MLVVLHTCPNGVFQLGRFEKSRPVWHAGDGFVGLEDDSGHLDVNVSALLQGHAEAAQHDGNQTTGTDAGDEIEVFAWLDDVLVLGRLAIAYRDDSMHELIEKEQSGVSSNSSTVWKYTGLAGSSPTRKVLPSDRIRSGGPLAERVSLRRRPPGESISIRFAP